MAAQARLVPSHVPRNPDGLVLVLHGGGSRRSGVMVSPTQLSVLRMVPIAWRIGRAGRGRLAVYRLLNSTRGWATDRTPVDDAMWALEQLIDTHGPTDLPVSLVGHSLGGRAALLAGTHPRVQTVVALNPYLYPHDGKTQLRDRRVLIAHGTRDRVANPATAEAVARALSRTATLSFVRVVDAKHAMLARHRAFNTLAADFVLSSLDASWKPPEPRWREI
jgi:predicted esterase